ncbi:MAG: hypothetical protein WKF58_06890 [Ilumatobacteraceae bacterium]
MTTEMPCSSASPLRGSTNPAYPCGMADRDAGRHEAPPAARREAGVDAGEQVEPGVTVVRVAGEVGGRDRVA